jgi:hypothetical protein
MVDNFLVYSQILIFSNDEQYVLIGDCAKNILEYLPSVPDTKFWSRWTGAQPNLF